MSAASSRSVDKPLLIGIVAASGGIQALAEILGDLPREFPVPILVVQSIHPAFLEEFVARLDNQCLVEVVVAEDGQVPEPGKVYVASEDPFLLLVEGRLRLDRRDPLTTREPKNALFRSMARELGSGALAVILTGISPDGAAGMKEVRDAGGYTIVQDEATAVVAATPLFALRLNAACESIPIQEIAPRILELVATGLRTVRSRNEE
jgi:two-component system chemotaxis response regulator CheB